MSAGNILCLLLGYALGRIAGYIIAAYKEYHKEYPNEPRR